MATHDFSANLITALRVQLRDMLGANDYDSRWFDREGGQSFFVQLIALLFTIARMRFGYRKKYIDLRTDLFRKFGTVSSLMI